MKNNKLNKNLKITHKSKLTLKIQNSNFKQITSNTAITLIALIITIIVLLILAGITLNMVIGNSGIIKKARTCKRENRRSTK